jgi:hypothetical protein
VVSRVQYNRNLNSLLHTERLYECSRLLRFRFHWTGGATIGSTESSHNGIASPIIYSIPQCRIGERFLSKLTELLRSARTRTCNAEKVVVFISVILQKRKGVTQARDIKLRREKRLEHWDKGLYRDLVNNVVNNANGGSTSRSTPMEESFARAYNAKILSGHIRQAV